MKDNFSKLSRLYAQFRPTYPKELFDFLLSLVRERKTAWDCGTGTGQLAVELAAYFDKVYATDISENQIRNAVVKDNISYTIERAEQSSFSINQFDLITVGQAVHWFDFPRFYKEVERTLKPDGVLALIGYSLVRVDAQTDKIIDHLYEQTIGSYWDKERKYVDEHYQTIPFPYREMKAPILNASYDWDLEQFVGYINTWSAVQHYKERNSDDPIDTIIDDLQNCWGKNGRKRVTFPMFLRVGVKGHSEEMRRRAEERMKKQG